MNILIAKKDLTTYISAWYEYGGKSSKFFLNLEKSSAIQGQIRYLLSGDYELTNKKEINNHLYMFYKSLFTENKKLSETQITYFLDEISNFPNLILEILLSSGYKLY